MVDLSASLTVFVLSIEGNPNYLGCIEALKKQTVQFKLDIIKDICPQNKAMQEMINRCKTPYFIQCDGDFILYPNAIEIVYNTLKQSDSKTFSYIFKLLDEHLNKKIDALKCYKYEIVKNYKFNILNDSTNTDGTSDFHEQIEKNGYKTLKNKMVMGIHSPLWTNKLIYQRYYTLTQKIKKYKWTGWGDFEKIFLERLLCGFNEIDFWALLGVYSAKLNLDFNIKNTQLNPKKLNILKVIDQFGWAYFFIAKEQQKYSEHNIEYCRLQDLNKYLETKTPDIIYFPQTNISNSVFNIIPEIKKSPKFKNTKIIGAHSGMILGKYPYADLIVAIDYNDIEKLKKTYPGIHVVFLPESIDTNFFLPKKEFDNTKFKVGWVGRINCGEKRNNLLQQLNYPIETQTQHGKEFFIETRTLEPMKKFYQSLDCLVLMSEQECMPRSVLEAMACGIPVISTPVGSVPILLNEEWMVPIEQTQCIKEMNQKLKLLEKNPNLRKEIGKKNRERMEEQFSWKVNQPLWDKVFKSLYYDDFDTIELITDDFLKKAKTIINPSLRILEIVDQYGWAFYFNYLERKKYSKYNLDCIKIEELYEKLNDFDFTKYDIMYFHSPVMFHSYNIPILKKAKESGLIIIGSDGGEANREYPAEYIDLFATLSLNFLPTIKKRYLPKQTVWLPKGIDTNYFLPNKFNRNRFNVGWVGREAPVKRTHLLDKLKYPVIKQCSGHNEKLFLKETNLDPMKEFYKTIDVLVLTSSSEAMPRVVLEAMACGIPVISTDVGSIRLLLEPQWIVPVEEDKTVDSMNKCLDILKQNPKLRKQIGERNRLWVEKYFSWSLLQPKWDKIYKSIYEKDYETIKNLTNNYLTEIKTAPNIIVSTKLDNTIISYYINEQKSIAEKYLLSSVKNLKLNYYINEVPSLGNWRLNSNYRIDFIKQFLLTHEEDVIFINIDATINSYPSLFDEIPEYYDIAIHYTEETKIHNKIIPKHPLCGTIFLRNNEKVLKFLDSWEKELPNCEQRQRIAFEIALKQNPDIKLFELPSEYCYVVSTNKKSPTIVPIISHY